jgi:hypothetical protein
MNSGDPAENAITHTNSTFNSFLSVAFEIKGVYYD